MMFFEFCPSFDAEKIEKEEARTCYTREDLRKKLIADSMFKGLSVENLEQLICIVEELYQLNNSNDQSQATTMSSILSDLESTFKAHKISAHAVNCVGAFQDHVRSGILRAVDMQRSGTSPEEVWLKFHGYLFLVRYSIFFSNFSTQIQLFMLHRIRSFPFNYNEVNVDVVQLFVKENGEIRWENEQTLNQYRNELGEEGVRKQLSFMFRKIKAAKQGFVNKMISAIDQDGREEAKQSVQDLFGFYVPDAKPKQPKGQNIKI